MSHIPASAMPHAAPHHHDDEPGPAQAAAMTREPTATAIFADTPPTPVSEPAPTQAETPAASTQVAPATPDTSSSTPAAPARAGWGRTALLLGGAALAATSVVVALPALRSSERTKRKA